MKDKIKDLLNVLSMTDENEILGRLSAGGYLKEHVRQGITSVDYAKYYLITCKSFAGLAFRLRDVACNLDTWDWAQRIVYDYKTNLPENRKSFEWSKKHTKYYEDYKDYFSDKAQRTDWIIAALIAKELAKAKDGKK